MYIINKAKTGISDLDLQINNYLEYLSVNDILPDGTYCLAGGCIRSIFDKTRLKDLDIYILGTEFEHLSIIDEIIRKYNLTKTILENPFAKISLVTVPKTLIINNKKEIQSIPILGSQDSFYMSSESESFPEGFEGFDLQIMSYMYDSKFSSRLPNLEPIHNRYADTTASVTKEILSSFDLTLSTAGVEFTLNNKIIAVSSVHISQEFLVDVCMRKLVLSKSNPDIPQQLTSLRRFHKFVELGYKANNIFYNEWSERLKTNPYVLELSYD